MVKKMLLSLLVLQSPLMLECKPSMKDGQSFGKSESKKAMRCANQVDKKELLPINEKSKTFDVKEAYRKTDSNAISSSEVVSFLTSNEVRKNERENKNFHENELFLQQSEDIAKQAKKEITVVETKNESSFIRKCRQAEDPILMTAERSLKVKIKNKARDREIKERWVYDNQELWDLSKSADCTVIEKICLDDSSRTIKGELVQRPCWRERISFLYQFPKTKECAFLRRKQCEQIDQQCIQESPFGCALWEKTFRCFDRLSKSTILDCNDITGLNEEEWESDYQPNESFGEVTAKLAVFEEAKKELEKSKTKDASKLEIFGGKKMKCSKSVADKLLYDCCFKYAGLAKRVGLSKCDSDEISLAGMQEKGLCHYIGSYEKKVLGIKKSDEHVFCCFPSKLARIVQEEGRKQLKKGWGDPEDPNCRGMNFEILAKLDFAKMDLSEMYEDERPAFPDDFDEKIQAFQNKVKEQIQKEGKESKK